MPLISQAPDLTAGLHDTMRQAPAPHINTQSTLRCAQYITALKRMDWDFEHAEGNAWRRGRDELQRLRAEQAEIDPSGELWRQYAPIEYHTHLLASA